MSVHVPWDGQRSGVCVGEGGQCILEAFHGPGVAVKNWHKLKVYHMTLCCTFGLL